MRRTGVKKGAFAAVNHFMSLEADSVFKLDWLLTNQRVNDWPRALKWSPIASATNRWKRMGACGAFRQVIIYKRSFWQYQFISTYPCKMNNKSHVPMISSFHFNQFNTLGLRKMAAILQMTLSFVKTDLRISIKMLLKLCSRGSNRLWVSIGQGNGLALNRRQDITTPDDLVHSHTAQLTSNC